MGVGLKRLHKRIIGHNRNGLLSLIETHVVGEETEEDSIFFGLSFFFTQSPETLEIAMQYTSFASKDTLFFEERKHGASRPSMEGHTVVMQKKTHCGFFHFFFPLDPSPLRLALFFHVYRSYSFQEL